MNTQEKRLNLAIKHERNVPTTLMYTYRTNSYK